MHSGKNIQNLSVRVENIVEKKEKLLVTSIFSFFHNVFKQLFTQGGLCGTVNPLPDHKNSDWSKLKQIADNITMCI